MTTLEKIRAQRNEILAIAHKYGATNLRVFGSVLHGDDREDSDIDILADWEDWKRGIDKVYIKNELELLTGKKVDFVIAKNLHWYIKDAVIQEAQPI